MDGKTIIVAAAVAGVVFCGVIFLPVDRLFAPGQQTGQFGPLTTTVDSQFQRVDTRKLTPAQIKADADQRERQMTSVMGEMMGLRKISSEEMTAAMNDVPRHDGYYRYATLPKSAFRTEMTPETDVDMHVACFSSRGDGQSWQAGEIVHMMVRYDETALGSGTPVDLTEWIYSGCAEAIRSNGRDLNYVQYMMTMRDLLPKTSAFDNQRRDMMAKINDEQHKRNAG